MLAIQCAELGHTQTGWGPFGYWMCLTLVFLYHILNILGPHRPLSLSLTHSLSLSLPLSLSLYIARSRSLPLPPSHRMWKCSGATCRAMLQSSESSEDIRQAQWFDTILYRQFTEVSVTCVFVLCVCWGQGVSMLTFCCLRLAVDFSELKLCDLRKSSQCAAA